MSFGRTLDGLTSVRLVTGDDDCWWPDWSIVDGKSGE